MNRVTLLAAGSLTLVALATPVRAQDSAAPTSRPPGAVTDPAVRTALGLPRMTQDAPPISPAQEPELVPVRPGLTEGHDWLEGFAVSDSQLPLPARLPEGIFRPDREGTVWPGPAGLWIFLPDAQGRLPGEGAMILAPNATLDRLSSSLESQPGPMPVRISGQTLLYYSHNYFLLTDYTRLSPGAGTPPQAPAETPPATSDQPADPEVDALIADLQGQSRSEARRSDALRERLLASERGQAQGAAQAVGTPPLLPDGSYISQRRARLERSAAGQWALTFDNDADTLGDSPLIVIPGRTLMRMEARAGTARTMTMTVSGRVYTSAGRGYIHPILFTVDPPADVQPLQ